MGFTYSKGTHSIALAAKVRTLRPGMSYVTTTARERRPVFEIARVAELFIDTLLHYRRLGHYKLHAYVVMPDHVHLVLTPQSITLGQAIGLIKSGLSHRAGHGTPRVGRGFHRLLHRSNT